MPHPVLAHGCQPLAHCLPSQTAESEADLKTFLQLRVVAMFHRGPPGMYCKSCHRTLIALTDFMVMSKPESGASDFTPSHHHKCWNSLFVPEGSSESSWLPMQTFSFQLAQVVHDWIVCPCQTAAFTGRPLKWFWEGTEHYNNSTKWPNFGFLKYQRFESNFRRAWQEHLVLKKKNIVSFWSKSSSWIALSRPSEFLAENLFRHGITGMPLSRSTDENHPVSSSRVLLPDYKSPGLNIFAWIP